MLSARAMQAGGVGLLEVADQGPARSDNSIRKG